MDRKKLKKIWSVAIAVIFVGGISVGIIGKMRTGKSNTGHTQASATSSNCGFSDWRAKFWSDYPHRMQYNKPADPKQAAMVQQQLGGYPIETRYLQLQPNAQLLFAERKGGTVVGRLDGNLVPIRKETAPSLFQPIENEKQAAELAMTVETGRLITCPEHYQMILQKCGEMVPEYLKQKNNPTGKFGLQIKRQGKRWLVSYTALSYASIYERELLIDDEGRVDAKTMRLAYGPMPPGPNLLKNCDKDPQGADYYMCKADRENKIFRQCANGILDGRK